MEKELNTSGMFWQGRPLSELSKDELIAIIAHLVAAEKRAGDRMRHQLQLLGGM